MFLMFFYTVSALMTPREPTYNKIKINTKYYKNPRRLPTRALGARRSRVFAAHACASRSPYTLITCDRALGSARGSLTRHRKTVVVDGSSWRSNNFSRVYIHGQRSKHALWQERPPRRR